MDERAMDQALAWQTRVWDGIADTYVREIDRRFTSVVAAVIARAAVAPGERILDLGIGTGAVAAAAARMTGVEGQVVAVDISPQMLTLARARVESGGLVNVALQEGRAEAIPAANNSFDVVLASLSLMFVIDRDRAAREIARVLRPGGRLVAAVWGPAAQCDIVRFQQIAGSFAGTPPVSGVGPGALADPGPFLQQLAAAGIEAGVDSEALGFEFENFETAWNVLASVTTAQLAPESLAAAKAAVRLAMYPAGDGPRRFENLTRFVVGSAQPSIQD